MTTSELHGAVRTYGAAYERDPKDKATGLAFAAALQMTGRNDQSLAVMQQVAIAHPKDRDVLVRLRQGARGRRRPGKGARNRAPRPDAGHPGLAALFGRGRDPRPARPAASRRAPSIARRSTSQPNEPSILSNLGMSYVLANDLASAETYLQARRGPAGRRQPRPAEPRAGRRPPGPLRRGREDRLAPNSARRTPPPTSPISARCSPSRTPGRC